MDSKDGSAIRPIEEVGKGGRSRTNRLLCLLLAGVPLAGFAQADGAAAAVARPAPSAARTAASSTPNSPNRSAPFDGSLEQLRDRLALRPEQQGLWQAYESSVNAYLKQHYREMPVLPNPQDGAPRQVGRLVDNLQNRLAALEDVERATKNLYAGLSFEQQETSNQLLLLTIPSFAPMADGPAGPKDPAARKGDRKEGGMRGRHSPGAGMGSVP